jgi:hypothetical protein
MTSRSNHSRSPNSRKTRVVDDSTGPNWPRNLDLKRASLASNHRKLNQANTRCGLLCELCWSHANQPLSQDEQIPQPYDRRPEPGALKDTLIARGTSPEVHSMVNNLSLGEQEKPQPLSSSHKRVAEDDIHDGKRCKANHNTNNFNLPSSASGLVPVRQRSPVHQQSPHRHTSSVRQRSLVRQDSSIHQSLPDQLRQSAIDIHVQQSQPPPYDDAPSSPVEDDEIDGLESDPTLLLQPETRRITQEQLINEVKGIYAGLVMVEKKCVEITQSRAKSSNKLSNDQWQALIALHRTLLQEHHDFFLASQHPTASPALRRLARKYAMPARMWRHGIHSFLELLRQQLPDSLEHMLAFVYIAYSMMALLMESVPSFLETWIECLGDIARYR